MVLSKIMEEIGRKATCFETGGFRPAGTLDESWIGSVKAGLADEGCPKDGHGASMAPLAQFGLAQLPFVPTALMGFALVTIFMGRDRLPQPFARNGEGFLVRVYKQTDSIVAKDYGPGLCKAMPLRPVLVERDFPNWDDPALPREIQDQILALQEKGEMDSYYDHAPQAFGHKLGGYPSFCQTGVSFAPGYEFVLQLGSDEKAGLNVVDGGSLMFAYNRTTNDWMLYYDFM